VSSDRQARLPADRYVLLSGGVGGAKLALGLDRALPPGALDVVANTGDDFRHLGLAISPDLDTLMYTLAGVVDPATGWGRADETWSFMEALGELGGETWFRLGDRDLATHVERTRRLAAGEPPSEIAMALCARFGLATRLWPMSETPIETRVATPSGELAFQHYFVRERAAPAVTGVRYAGAATARPPAGLLAALRDSALRAVFIAPSNPWLSIGPLLAIAPLRAAVVAAGVPVIAVSPIVGGAALKGPTARIMRSLGLPVTQAAIARCYRGLADALVIDRADAADAAAVEQEGLQAAVAATVMRTLEDRIALARELVALVGRVACARRAS
jgi:LPPG:FO 2-phospho-L-lactate transferase